MEKKSFKVEQTTVYKNIRIYVSKLRDKQGFTLVESLISLSIIMIIASLFPMILTQVQNISGKAVNHQDINIQLFLRDIQEEIKGDTIDIQNGKLRLMKSSISYEFHNNRIVRKKNGSGYIIMLENIEDAQFYFKEDMTWIYLKVKINVQTYEVHYKLQ